MDICYHSSVWVLHVQTAFSPFVCVVVADGLMHILRGLRFEEGTRLCRDSQGFYGHMGWALSWRWRSDVCFTWPRTNGNE